MLPYAPTEGTGDIRHDYRIDSYYNHMVANYANISIDDTYQLDVLDYLALRRDAVIYELSRTSSGTDYLNDAWAHEQTEPDIATLRADFGSTRLEG